MEYLNSVLVSREGHVVSEVINDGDQEWVPVLWHFSVDGFESEESPVPKGVNAVPESKEWRCEHSSEGKWVSHDVHIPEQHFFDWAWFDRVEVIGLSFPGEWVGHCYIKIKNYRIKSE